MTARQLPKVNVHLGSSARCFPLKKVLTKVRFQGHYAQTDQEIPPEQLRTLEDTLKKHGTKVEGFTYPAAHGFFAYTRKT